MTETAMTAEEKLAKIAEIFETVTEENSIGGKVSTTSHAAVNLLSVIVELEHRRNIDNVIIDIVTNAMQRIYDQLIPNQDVRLKQPFNEPIEVKHKHNIDGIITDTLYRIYKQFIEIEKILKS